MDQRLLSIYLSRILSGFYIFLYSGKKYKLVYPDISVKYEAEIYANEEYDKNKFNDWISEDAIIDTLVNLGIWTYNGDDGLKNLEKQMDDMKVELYQNFLNPAKLKNIRRNLLNTKNTYDKHYNIRHSFDHITPEGYVQGLKNQYILMHSIYDLNNCLVFDKDYDYNLFNNITSFISENYIDIPTFKKIARSDNWRNYWTANKEYIFDKPTINWTDEQKTLIVLTKMYDSAYEHPECPADSVFEDDDIFDGWLIYQKRENEKTKNKNRTDKLLQGKNLDNANEIFVKANSKQEANNIHDLNDNTAKHIIKERQIAIKRAGNSTIDDSSLPDVQRELTIQSNQAFMNRKK